VPDSLGRTLRLLGRSCRRDQEFAAHAGGRVLVTPVPGIRKQNTDFIRDGRVVEHASRSLDHRDHWLRSMGAAVTSAARTT
jgi:hypothetical protein